MELISFVESNLPSPLLEEDARLGLKCNIGSDVPKKSDMVGSAKWLASTPEFGAASQHPPEG
jgi:hypothetical protein